MTVKSFRKSGGKGFLWTRSVVIGQEGCINLYVAKLLALAYDLLALRILQTQETN